MGKRGYYRVPKKSPANRVDGALTEIVRTKFVEGWPKARIAREFRLNRRTVARICAKSPVANLESPPRTVSSPMYYSPILRKRRRFLIRQWQVPAQNQDK